MRKYIFFFLCIIFLLPACKESEKKRIARLVTEWQGKEILFPSDSRFSIYGTEDTTWQIPASNYKVLVYVDSIGCTSCKLQLHKWKELISEVDSLTGSEVPFLFYFHSADYKEIRYLLKRDAFNIPVCVDTDDRLNKLNHFPSEMTFQTFLIDKDNKVIVLGNPVHNTAVKDLYIKQITGRLPVYSSILRTTAQAEISTQDLSVFKKDEKKTAIFRIQNTGDHPLVIVDVSTTCGCARAIYEKHPAQPNEYLQIEVEMVPQDIGFFDETITIKCNTPQPIKLKIKGHAQ